MRNNLASKRARLWLALAMFALWGSAAESSGRTDNGKILFIRNDRKIILVDFKAGSAKPLAIEIGSGGTAFLSPDQSSIAVIGTEGVTVVSISGEGAAALPPLSRDPCYQAAWSPDGNDLAFLQESTSADGKVETAVYSWNKKTGRTKRVL